MFTGIIEITGSVVESGEERGGRTLAVHAPFKAALGESIAVDGACVTVSGLMKEGFRSWLSPETLARTTLGSLRPGSRVHIERALPADGRLGGHMVTGHVDGVAEVRERREEGDAIVLALEAPRGMGRYLAPRGSVALAGVSLTVNEVEGDRFRVTLVPFTRRLTFLGDLGPGSAVDFEADVIMKQVVTTVERILGAGGGGGVTEELLLRTGFMREDGDDG